MCLPVNHRPIPRAKFRIAGSVALEDFVLWYEGGKNTPTVPVFCLHPFRLCLDMGRSLWMWLCFKMVNAYFIIPRDAFLSLAKENLHPRLMRMVNYSAEVGKRFNGSCISSCYLIIESTVLNYLYVVPQYSLPFRLPFLYLSLPFPLRFPCDRLKSQLPWVTSVA